MRHWYDTRDMDDRYPNVVYVHVYATWLFMTRPAETTVDHCDLAIIYKYFIFLALLHRAEVP